MRLAVIASLLLVAACRPPGYGKDEPPDAAESMADGGPTADAGVDAVEAAVCDHAFSLEGYGTASSVWLTGTFVEWAATPGAGAIPLTLDAGGAWTGSYPFPAGTHYYKFVVDSSNWILDPANPRTAEDGNGNVNSVYTCVP